VSWKTVIADDEPALRDVPRKVLEDHSFQGRDFDITAVPSGEAALEHIAKYGADLLITDYNMKGGMHGLEFADKLRSKGYTMPIILYLLIIKFEQPLSPCLMQLGEHHKL